MSKGWYYSSGDWSLHCDVCGKKIKASESKKRWDGFVVCSEDFEVRHSQDFVRAKPEKISVPFSRRNPDVFITVIYSNYWDSTYTIDTYIDGDLI